MTVVTVLPGKRERSKAAVRARIIEHAVRLFAERGIDAVTVDDIAAAADVGKGTIYNYVRTKEDLIVAFLAGVERDVQGQLRDLDTSRLPLQKALSRFVKLQFQLKAPHHRFVRVFFAQMFLRTDTFTPYMAEIHELTRSTTEQFFRLLRERGAIRRDVSLEDVTLVFTNMLLGLFALWAIEGPPFRGVEHALTREIAFLCQGLEPRKR
jgi:AcrR family transcriptional regulator